VTVALGAMASDGLVMCADSQYTSGCKTEGQKVFQWFGKSAAVLFALAGDVANATMAIQECKAALTASRSKPTADNLKNIVKIVVRIMQETYVDKRPKEEREDAAFYLLVALAAKGSAPQLYYSQAGALVQFDEYFAVGSGGDLAEMAMKRSYAANMKVRDVIPLSACAIASAKRHDAYCGGPSQFTSITEGVVSSVVPFDLRSLENMIFEHERRAAALFLDAGNQSMSDKRFGEEILKFKMQSEDMRAAFRRDGAPWRVLVNQLEAKQVSG
jgi:20S proteasome alpha/beta subunit